jgi:hypothetical protein
VNEIVAIAPSLDMMATEGVVLLRQGNQLAAEAFGERLCILRLAKAQHDEVEIVTVQGVRQRCPNRVAAPHTISLFVEIAVRDSISLLAGLKFRGACEPSIASARQLSKIRRTKCGFRR